MKTELATYRQRLNLFNRWEDEQLKRKTEQEKLRQFEILFTLIFDQFSETAIERERKRHLENLMTVQQRLLKNKPQSMQLKYKNNPDISLLAGIFAGFPGICAVYLFGSTIENRNRPESDLDLAIVPDGPNIRQQRMEILHHLAKAGFCHVDLIFLDTKDIVLKYEAVYQNKLIYQRNDFERGTYYSKIIRQYLDFLTYLNDQRAAYKRRILNDQT